MRFRAVQRCLTLLVEGAAAGFPQIDNQSYLAFRSRVEEFACRLTDHLPDEDKLAMIRNILHEFESYRDGMENALREQLGAWRDLVTILFGELLANLGVDAASLAASPLQQLVKHLKTGGEINAWGQKLGQYLHPLDGKGPAQDLAARLKAADCSTANDNAAGLRGGGSAVEHLRKIVEQGGDGFIVLFRLSCIDIINQRFGAEAVEDCLMAVSAFLTTGLQSEDSIYHWSDSALLAILQGRYSEFMVTAELDRIIAQNRESSINVAGRAIMLRIPISFELTPINRLRSAEDLLKISALHAAKRYPMNPAAMVELQDTDPAKIDPIEELPLPYVEVDARGFITRANRASIALHHVEGGQLVGKLAWDLVASDEKDLSFAAYCSSLQSGEKPMVVERSIYDRSGQFRTYEIYRSLVRDSAGNPGGCHVPRAFDKNKEGTGRSARQESATSEPV